MEPSLLEQLVLDERREDARRQGISLGELLEQAAFEQAILDSQIDSATDLATAVATNDAISTAGGADNGRSDDGGGGAAADDDDDDEDFDGVPVPIDTTADAESEVHNSGSVIELSEVDHHMWYHLPQVLQDKILIHLLDVDILGALCCVSKNNSFLRPSQLVFKRVCEHIYLNQAKRKVLSVDKWKGSYRNMLIYRPRLRLNGFYSLRTTFTKAPCNDAFWEERRIESIEAKFYRHFRFFNSGRLLYCLDVVAPDDLPKIFNRQIPKKVFEGAYTLQGRSVQVEIPMHYCVMFFQMQLCDGNEGFDLGYVGKFNLLKLIDHSSLSMQASLGVNQTSFGGQVDQFCRYNLPLDCDIRFYKVKQWS